MVLKKFYYLKFWNKFLRIIEVIIFSIKKKKTETKMMSIALHRCFENTQNLLLTSSWKPMKLNVIVTLDIFGKAYLIVQTLRRVSCGPHPIQPTRQHAHGIMPRTCPQCPYIFIWLFSISLSNSRCPRNPLPLCLILIFISNRFAF